MTNLNGDNTKHINFYVEEGNLPSGSMVEIPVFNGTRIYEDLQHDIPNASTLYGWLYIYRTYDGTTYYLTLMPYYNSNVIYMNTYTTMNGNGWLESWKKITRENI